MLSVSHPAEAHRMKLCRVVVWKNIPLIVNERRPPHLEAQIGHSEGVKYSNTNYPGCHGHGLCAGAMINCGP